MKYGLLNRSEWPHLEPIFKEYGSSLPRIGNISVATNSKGISAFQCAQPVMHVEPLWVHPDYSGKVQFRELLKPLIENLTKGTSFYAFAPNELIERMCAHCGLEKIPWTIWKGTV